ncbi:MAG: hypothetical protein IJX63_09600 [Lachnospiraceae bacterium]|nr:hypothetical protein [Lachnospiraceae bacterium]
MLISAGNDKIIIGYDLANTSSQISYCYLNGKNEVETLAAVAGEENYDIPTVLCKKCGMNQWFFGKDALRFEEENPKQGIIIDNLLQIALDGETIQLEGEGYEPEALLTLFVKRSLGLLAGIAPLEKIQAIQFTCEEITPRLVEVLNVVVNGLGLKNAEIRFQSYQESYYGYMLYQHSDLWLYRSILFDYRGKDLKILQMEKNKRTTPMVIYIGQDKRIFHGEDAEFQEIAREYMEESRISSVFLIGEKFAEGWLEDSLKYLCNGRRVFQGNNLYSKGACFSLLERLKPSEAGKAHAFLGSDKLKANVGMKVLKRGEDSYFALLDAGVDWYEVDFECEVYLQDENVLELLVTPLINSTVKNVQIPLEGLGLKEEEATRVYLHFTMQQVDVLCIEIEDLGFGCFRAPVQNKWKEEIKLY